MTQDPRIRAERINLSGGASLETQFRNKRELVTNQLVVLRDRAKAGDEPHTTGRILDQGTPQQRGVEVISQADCRARISITGGVSKVGGAYVTYEFDPDGHVVPSQEYTVSHVPVGEPEAAGPDEHGALVLDMLYRTLTAFNNTPEAPAAAGLHPTT